MKFEELIKAKDEAVSYDDACAAAVAEAAAAVAQAQAAHEKTVADHAKSTAICEAAHKAIADLLAERGEHYLIDQKNGTLTVYKPHSELPGYLAVHPIPGTTKAS